MPSEKECTDISSQKAIQTANHVTWVGFWYNIALGGAKIAGGIFGRSSALIADGVHSLSANRIIELTPNGIIDKMMEYDEYITSDHIKELRAKMYGDK